MVHLISNVLTEFIFTPRAIKLILMAGSQMKHNRQKSNRTSQKPKCNRDISERIKSPNFTPKKSKSKPTTSNSDGAYFQSKKPKLPKEAEEESNKERFLKKHKKNLIEKEVMR